MGQNLLDTRFLSISPIGHTLKKSQTQLPRNFLISLYKPISLIETTKTKTNKQTTNSCRKKKPRARKSKKRKEKQKMCLVFVCDEDQRVLSRQPAPGACPFCGGVVQATDVQTQWRFCFLPLYWKTKRKLYCSICTRELVVQ